MIREEVLSKWNVLKGLFARHKAVRTAEKQLNKMIPQLEDKIRDLDTQKEHLSQEKRELTDKLSIYQECFVIAVKKSQPSRQIFSNSGKCYPYPEWHSNKKMLLSSKLPCSFSTTEIGSSLLLTKWINCDTIEENKRQLTLYFNN